MKKLRDRPVYIAGKRWMVTFPQAPIVNDGEVLHGLTQTSKNVIAVSQNETSRDTVRSTLLHELLHAIVKSISNGHSDSEEVCVTATETGLYSLIREKRNGWVLDLLTEED